MTTSDKLREFGQKVMREYGRWWDVEAKDADKFVSDLIALISEHYVPKDDYDKLGRLMDQLAEADEKQTSELLQQRDELREALEEQKRLYFNLFDEDVSCMYCEVKLKRGSAIILCKECAESTEV